MGNWDNLYHEIKAELKLTKAQDKFDKLLLKLNTSEEFKYHPAREKWRVALSMIRNNEY